MARTSFNISVDYTIDYNLFEDLLVTAYEGGSNYWLYLPVDERNKLLSMYPNEPISIAISKAVFNDDMTVLFKDQEDEDTTYSLSAGKVEPNVRKMIKKGYSDVFIRWVDGNIDADDADVILQHIVLGELVFG